MVSVIFVMEGRVSTARPLDEIAIDDTQIDGGRRMPEDSTSTTRRNGTGAAHGRGIGQAAATLLIALLLVLSAATAATAAEIEKDAKEILRSMSDYLGGLTSFSVDADIDNEVVNQQGQKLHLNSSAELVIDRPGNLYVHRKGGAGEVELIFDGKVVTIHGIRRNLYMQIDSPGNIDLALQTTSIETGIDFPGADLFFSNPYDGLMHGVVSGTYLGSGYVNGIECHHLAFRAAQVDWQIWVQTGDVPLPMKYAITTKWVTAAPQYVARLRNWNTTPKIEAKQFDFSPEAGAKKVDSIPTSETGELSMEKK